MSAEAAALVRSWSVGRYTCTLTVPQLRAGVVSSVVIEWAPEQPERLTAAEIDAYKRGRNEAIKALGLNALVIDV